MRGADGSALPRRVGFAGIGSLIKQAARVDAAPGSRGGGARWWLVPQFRGLCLEEAGDELPLRAVDGTRTVRRASGHSIWQDYGRGYGFHSGDRNGVRIGLRQKGDPRPVGEDPPICCHEANACQHRLHLGQSPLVERRGGAEVIGWRLRCQPVGHTRWTGGQHQSR
jgi:hypothetical protein